MEQCSIDGGAVVSECAGNISGGGGVRLGSRGLNVAGVIERLSTPFDWKRVKMSLALSPLSPGLRGRAVCGGEPLRQAKADDFFKGESRSFASLRMTDHVIDNMLIISCMDGFNPHVHSVPA